MRKYEAILVANPHLGEEELKAFLGKVEKKIESAGGKVDKMDRWGKRRLNVTFQKHRKLTDAHFIAVFFNGPNSTPNELKAFLKIQEELLRFQVVSAFVAPILAPKRSSPQEEKVEVAPEILVKPAGKESVG